MEIEEKCKIINQIINNGLKCQVASATPRHTREEGVWLTLKKHEFHDWNSILLANLMEQIYRKTDLIWVALDRNDDSVTIYLQNANILDSCDKDGTLWEDTMYRAKCPDCGETKSFDLMRYLPSDYRTMHCPKCKFEGHVYDFWASVLKK